MPPVAVTAATIVAGLALAFMVLSEPASGGFDRLSDTVTAPGDSLITVVRSEGPQVSECQPDAQRALLWDRDHPIVPVTRHASTSDQEIVVAAQAPGATQSDVPLPALEATSQRDVGPPITMVRPATSGMREGPCPGLGDLTGVASPH